MPATAPGIPQLASTTTRPSSGPDTSALLGARCLARLRFERHTQRGAAALELCAPGARGIGGVPQTSRGAGGSPRGSSDDGLGAALLAAQTHPDANSHGPSSQSGLVAEFADAVVAERLAARAVDAALEDPGLAGL